MKYIAIILLICFTLPVLTKDKAKFYDFSDMMIEGDFKKPEMLSVKDKVGTKFDKMLKLKASFLRKLEDTDKDSAIK